MDSKTCIEPVRGLIEHVFGPEGVAAVKKTTAELKVNKELSRAQMETCGDAKNSADERPIGKATAHPVEGHMLVRVGRPGRDPGSHEPQDRIMAVRCAQPTTYWHYECAGETDIGWGCAYRCLQMLQSHLADRLPGAIPREVPGLRQIQENLASISAIPASDIGSTRWIEPYEVHKYSKSFWRVDGPCGEFATKPDAVKRFLETAWQHLGPEGPQTPIMMDDSVYAYIVAGIARYGTDHPDADFDVANYLVLLFDPHGCGNLTIDQFESGCRTGAYWIRAENLFTSSRWMYFLPAAMQINADEKP